MNNKHLSVALASSILLFASSYAIVRLTINDSGTISLMGFLATMLALYLADMFAQQIPEGAVVKDPEMGD